MSWIRLYRLSGWMLLTALSLPVARAQVMLHSDHKMAAEPHAPGPAGVHRVGSLPSTDLGRGGFCQPAPALPLSVLNATAQGSLSPNPSPT